MKIELVRAEGLPHEVGKPQVVETFTMADHILRGWSDTAPKKNLGYHKVDIKLKDDEKKFNLFIRYDLVHWEVETVDIKRHVVGFMRFMAGENCPTSMQPDRYEAFLVAHGMTEKLRLDTLAASNWVESLP
jgi:hypothetical protein